MRLEDLTWLAATIDCDGTIGIYRNGLVVVSVSMTSKEYIEEVQLRSGLGTIFSVTPAYEGAQLQWRWQANTDKWSGLGYLCELLIPHLIIKKQQAQLVMYFMQAKRDGTLSPAAKKMYYETSRQLNGAQFKGQGPGRPRKGSSQEIEIKARRQAIKDLEVLE